MKLNDLVNDELPEILNNSPMIVNINNKGEVFSKNPISHEAEDFVCVISYEYDDEKYNYNSFDVKLLPDNVMPDGLSITKGDVFHNDNGNITFLPPRFTISGAYTKLPEIPKNTMLSLELTFNHEKIDEEKISSIFAGIAKIFDLNIGVDFNLFSYFNLDMKNYETEFIVSKDILINWEYVKTEVHIPDVNVAYTVDSTTNKPIINITPVIPEELSGSINLNSFNFRNFVELDSEGKPTDTNVSDIGNIFRDEYQFNRGSKIENNKWTYTFSAINAMTARNTLTLLKYNKQVGVKVSYEENGETKYVYGKVIFDITFNQIQAPFSFSAERVPDSCGGICMEEPWTGTTNDTYICIGKENIGQGDSALFVSQTLLDGNKNGFYCTWECDHYDDYEDKTYWYLCLFGFENRHYGAEFRIGINGEKRNYIKVPDTVTLENSHTYMDCYSFKNPVVSY